MSLPDMQKALALFIRLPEHNRGEDLAEFLTAFELDELEHSQLEAIATDRKVVKYGRSMAGVRWEHIQGQLRFCHRYLNVEAMDYLWRLQFEPTATTLSFRALGPAFVDFLLQNPAAQEFLKVEAPPFFNAMLKFERAQMNFRVETGREKTLAASESLLAHTAFEVLELDYDIAGFLATLEGVPEEEKATLAPEPRPIFTLLIPNEGKPGCRFFEVDAAVRDFLIGQRQTPPVPAEPPESYADLVSLKLCKPLN